LDDDPVVAGENASDLVLVSLGQKFDAHSGIIADILFGSGSAGLGIGGRVLTRARLQSLFDRLG
jgi:lipid A disaccharide synthetase